MDPSCNIIKLNFSEFSFKCSLQTNLRMFKSVNDHKDFMRWIYTFSGGKYISIQFFQITLKKMRRNLLMPMIFRLERREKGKF